MHYFKSTSLQRQRVSFDDKRSKDTSSGKQVYVYHWNRIIAALVVVLILLAVSVYVVSLVFTDEKTVSQLSVSESNVEQVGVDQTRDSAKPSDFGRITDSQLEPNLGGAGAVGLNDSRSESTVKPADADQVTGPATPEHALPKTPLDAEVPSSEDSPAPDQVAETVAKPASQEKSATAGNSVFHLQSTQILSPDVARFELSSEVEDLEPVGRLQDITLHNNSSAKLFVYSDINNMKDEHLRYIWKHRGRIVNTVNIGVRSNRWRSYASKNIEQRLTGDWQVELRDSSGRLLAKAAFTFEPRH